MIGEVVDTPVSLEETSAQDASRVAALLGVDPSAGLEPQEAARRLQSYGPNAIAQHRTNAMLILFRQFKSPLLLLLLGAALLSAVLGDPSDASIIAIIVALSSGLGFFNEYRAAKAADALHDQIQHETVVTRGGRPEVVNVAEIVPGDVVSIKLGDVVPADLRLVAANELECDESVLTGEGLPVEKSTSPVGEGTPLAELSCCALAGTVVSSGSGVGLAVATGPRTKFGAIAAGLSEEQVETAFQAGLRRISMFLVYVGAVLTAAIFVINLVLHKPVLDALLFSLAIAVGITPQLLPAVVTTSLAAGSARLTNVKVLVKRLVCIEDLGDISMVFTDKTGTLTQGMPEFDRAVPASDDWASELLRFGLLTTESVPTDGDHAVGGNPLDQALWRGAGAGYVGAGAANLRGWERVGILPFDHERRMVSATVRGPDGTAWIITKGAPEVLLTRCRDVPGELAERVDAEFAQGSRVVAVATKRIPRADTAPTREDERDLEAVGLLVFRDPPKPDARASLERLADLGISIKVVTGDNPVVALKVCSDLGLPAAAAVTGPQLANMSDAELERAVQETTVFARVSPEDKARIVKAGRRLVGGVAFLGDGVNDALALHSADIGVSVDTATDVAKDAADVIMLEKDLDVLAGGVTEGRRIFANTIKYVMMGTSSNFGNMFSAAGASVFLPFLPMLPSQILLNNLLYDSGQLAIPTDRVDAEQLRKPSHWDIAFIRRFMVIFGPLSSVFDFLTFGLLLWVFGANESLFQTGWFVESLATQAMVIFVIRTRMIPSFRSRPSAPIVWSTLAVVAVGAALPLTPLAPMLHFSVMPWRLYLAIAVLVVAYLGLVELGKWFFYRTRPTGRQLAQRPASRRPLAHHLVRRVHWFHGGPPDGAPGGLPGGASDVGSRA